ncbi:MAG TPA: hypothetical protein VFE46_05565 [Pirellulales bacterium]|jgi:hypothetical protein|nr:hypothetical protein [Pirellulales bacterium]
MKTYAADRQNFAAIRKACQNIAVLAAKSNIAATTTTTASTIETAGNCEIYNAEYTIGPPAAKK